MARQSYAPRVEYTGNGLLSTYAFAFKIELSTQIRIVIYTVSGVKFLDTRGDDVVNLTLAFDPKLGGGTVTFPANLASGAKLLLLLADDQPLQPFEFKSKFSTTLTYLEDAFDWVTGPIQTLSYKASRSTQLDDADTTAGFNPNWPKGLSGTANMIPITNSTGTGWAAVGNWMSIPAFYDLAYAAVQAALAVLGGGGSLTAPTDGKYGLLGSGSTGTAGSITGNDVGRSVNDAVDAIESFLEKIAPARPANLSAVALNITGAYAANRSGTGAAVSKVIDSANPTIFAVAPFGDADYGTLSAEIDSVSVGSRALQTTSDVGTYGQLQITADADPYLGQPGKENIWKALNAQITSTALALGIHIAALKHSLTGNASLTFGVDDPGVTTTAIGAIVGSGTAIYISGVPSLPIGGSISVPVTISNAIRAFYNSTSVGAVNTTGSITSVGSVASPALPNNGDNVVASPNLTVLTNKYTEQVQVNANGINSKGVAGSVTSNTTNIRVDTASTESRVSSSTGQYPSSGYGSAWVSTDLLSANKELQMLGGSYQYPPLVNYSSNLPTAGPNYSALTADSYASMRWVTFNLGAKTSVTSLLFTVLGANLGTSNLVSGFVMQVRVDGGTPTAGWIDANAAYPGTGNPTANGDAALDVGSSSTSNTSSTRRVTLGAAVRTGTVFVRIGIPSGSTKKISSVTVA